MPDGHPSSTTTGLWHQGMRGVTEEMIHTATLQGAVSPYESHQEGLGLKKPQEEVHTYLEAEEASSVVVMLESGTFVIPETSHSGEGPEVEAKIGGLGIASISEIEEPHLPVGTAPDPQCQETSPETTRTSRREANRGSPEEIFETHPSQGLRTCFPFAEEEDSEGLGAEETREGEMIGEERHHI